MILHSTPITSRVDPKRTAAFRPLSTSLPWPYEELSSAPKHLYHPLHLSSFLPSSVFVTSGYSSFFLSLLRSRFLRRTTPKVKIDFVETRIKLQLMLKTKSKQKITLYLILPKGD